MSNPEGPRIVAPTIDDVETITDRWVELARDQRRHGSTLLASENRSAVREWVARSVVTGELLVARGGEGDGEGGDEETDGTGDEETDGTGDEGDGGKDDEEGDEAVDSGPIVGFVAFSIEREGYERDRTRGVVSNLFVSPSRRSEEIGSALLAAAERELVEAGADAVALEALADNERARSFYADRGYDLHRVELRKEIADGE
ncbi:GNAT family N-acetyltransferase [Halorubrum sp. 48-1-W]|uniref:GNAT family N-acetyltransferase n=1 Tax=Halorubrum sp. 48-1-W TaxID=2249761 RepID=UPI000DCC5887|nr:GNAT family N-acetyltransferase [Halorubrum sp. 48-1-W]RAW46865.1 GNAT family N-acetyltransferase [Halorubrum sp. 48-1-W]